MHDCEELSLRAGPVHSGTLMTMTSAYLKNRGQRLGRIGPVHRDSELRLRVSPR